MIPQKYVQRLFNTVCQKSFTDIYLLWAGKQYRIMGHYNNRVVLIGYLNMADGQRIMTYLKYQANMAVSEHRRPQSGAWRWQYRNQIINIRLSTVGDFRGYESMVLRFIYPLQSLSYRMLKPEQREKLKQMTAQAGLVLFAGPIGSGKTTTMYRLVREQYSQAVVLTIEDPVEVVEENFIQLQVNSVAGMGYPELLRLALRHHPQVLIIGEIRDPTTAKTAIEAALSGHVVLATIHAQSASGVIARLEQLGIEKYYVQQAVHGACYQRLVPLISRDDQGIIFDLQTFDQLQENQGGKIGDEWKAILQAAFDQGKITQKNRQKFWQG